MRVRMRARVRARARGNGDARAQVHTSIVLTSAKEGVLLDSEHLAGNHAVCWAERGALQKRRIAPLTMHPLPTSRSRTIRARIKVRVTVEVTVRDKVRVQVRVTIRVKLK